MRLLRVSARLTKRWSSGSLERELKELDKKVARLTDAIANGGDLAPLVAKLKELEERRVEIVDEQAAARPVPCRRDLRSRTG